MEVAKKIANAADLEPDVPRAQLLAGQFKGNFYFWFFGPNVNFYAWNDAQASKKGFFNDKKSLNDFI